MDFAIFRVVAREEDRVRGLRGMVLGLGLKVAWVILCFILSVRFIFGFNCKGGWGVWFSCVFKKNVVESIEYRLVS